MMIMQTIPFRFLFLAGLLCTLVFLAGAASGADVDMTGYLGDTFTLSGYSYVGNNVYLFMTGPGLPAGGVTLTDVSQRADQGHFTVVGVDENQQWTYRWDTQHLAPQIDAGTYIVYVSNEPADALHLGGSSSYKTYSFFLQESDISKVSIGAQHSYTLNPEEHTSTMNPVPPVNLTTVPITTPLPVTTNASPSPTTPPPTRSGTGGGMVVTALVLCISSAAFLKARQ